MKHSAIRHSRHPLYAQRNQGMMLIEVLVAILIFALGVLGITALQAASIKTSAGAEYRTIAALQANNVISSMWASNRTTAALQANFASANGAQYLLWLPAVQAALPGVVGKPANQPSIVFGAAVGNTTPVTVTVIWQAPGEATPHNYVAAAQLAP